MSEEDLGACSANPGAQNNEEENRNVKHA